MPDSEDIGGFPLEVVTSIKGAKRTFSTPEAYRDWFDVQRSFVQSWLNVSSGTYSGWVDSARNEVNNFFSHTDDQLNRISNALNQYAHNPDERDRLTAKHATSIRQQHDLLYGQGRLFASDTAEGKLLTKLAAQRSARALGAFIALREGEHIGTFARGLTDGALYRVGLKARAESEGEALMTLQAEWLDRFQQLEEGQEQEFSETISANRDALEALRGEHKEFMKELQANQQAQAERFHEIVHHAEGEFTRLKETYRQKLGLEAPVTYWKDKAVKHRWLAGGAAALVALAAGAFVPFFLDQVQTVLRPGSDPGTAEVIVLLTLATLGVWGIRIFVRLFFSQVHLSSDARERAVVIETFLALATSEKVEKDERIFALQTIFRPSSTGIVKDDSAPPSAPELLSRLLSKS